MSGPHDLLFRHVFSHRKRAQAAFRCCLPAQLSAQVDWSSLRPESIAVVDPELRETRKDLLFSARWRGRQAPPLYLLLEHQSEVEWWMAQRLHDYASRQVAHWRKEHPTSRQLPAFLCLVVYHGKGRAWSAPLRLEELVYGPGQGG